MWGMSNRPIVQLVQPRLISPSPIFRPISPSPISRRKLGNMEYNLTVRHALPYLETSITQESVKPLSFIKPIPITLLTSIVDTISGLAFRIFSLITFGTQQCLNRIALENGYSSSLLLSIPYMCVFRAICLPSDDEGDFSFDRFFMDNINLAETRISALGQLSSHFLEMHITTRLENALLCLAVLVAGIAEAIIATLLIPIALATAIVSPKHPACVKINSLAFRALMFPHVINDFGYFALKILNPWSSEFKQDEPKVLNSVQNLKCGNLLTSDGSIFNLWTGQRE